MIGKRWLGLVAVLATLVGPALADGTNSASGSRLRADNAAAADAERNERYRLVHKIVSEWGPYVRAIHGQDIREWADGLVPTLRRADTQKLRDAASADTYSGVVNALTGQKAPDPSLLPGGVAPKALGDMAADLVFTPLPQCNLVDTRLAGGPIAAGTMRHFKASGANFTAQGGSSTNCGIPANPYALLVGIAAVDAPARGWLKLWPYSYSQPSGSSLSYGPTQNTRIDTVLRVSQFAGAHGFTAISNVSGVHMMVTVLGYYAPPQATAVQCRYSQSPSVVPFNTLNHHIYGNSCPPSYTLVGVFCDGRERTQFLGSRIIPEPGSSPTRYVFDCAYNNYVTESEEDETVVWISQTCCRVPGR